MFRNNSKILTKSTKWVVKNFAKASLSSNELKAYHLNYTTMIKWLEAYLLRLPRLERNTKNLLALPIYIAQNMSEYWFYLACFFLYKGKIVDSVLIRQTKGQRKSLIWHILHKDKFHWYFSGISLRRAVYVKIRCSEKKKHCNQLK